MSKRRCALHTGELLKDVTTSQGCSVMIARQIGIYNDVATSLVLKDINNGKHVKVIIQFVSIAGIATK